ncbi:hypothetical protein [Blastococcus sp. KM273129]|uniref:hypothetical protein n=1 Tax=Blastococcus sp. KM273129 TaxID=2570315 RepID=UPI001F1C2988|nr:hypothetical protein [Blastococcus sp. KM273129]MCF6735234.1 hypothetical protein [Blastococcus sp. KM273129]
MLLIAEEAFPFDLRVWKHVDARRQEVDFDQMLSETTFSSQERLMLEIAASLWSSSTHPTILGVVAERLGDDWLEVLLRALAASRSARVRARSAIGSVP